MAAPVNTTAPALGGYTDPASDGSPQAGQTSVPLFNRGTWDGSPNIFTYLWLRVFSSDDPGEPAGNPDNAEQSYSPVQADVGYCLRCQVSASNGDGTTAAVSGMTSPVEGPPRCMNGPLVTPTSGGITGGVWGSLNIPGTPTVFVVESVWCYSGYPADPNASQFVWKLANPDGSITGRLAGGVQGGASYTVVPEDIGYRLYCEVTQGNSLGTTTDTSNMTDVLVQGAPIKYIGLTADQGMPYYSYSGTAPVIGPPLPPGYQPSPPPPPAP